MHKTPASEAGALDQLGGDPFPHTRTRKILKANPRAKARLKALLWSWPWWTAKRRRLAA